VESDVLYKGTRIVQADAVSDSNSESRNKNKEIIPVNRLTQTVCSDPLEPATTIHTRTVKQKTFFAPTGAYSRNRSRNLNLPALYAYPKAFHGTCIFVTVFTSAHREPRESIVHSRCDCNSNVSYCEGVEILHSEIKLRRQRCG
jgi:hypothetical protein